jgi:hypothetical protein
MKKILLGLILLSPTYYAHGAVNDPYRTPPRPIGRGQQAPGAPARVNEGGFPHIPGDFVDAVRVLNFSGSTGTIPPGGEPR